ncbi:hypothetical protein F5Y11DRAFT_367872 [Daldinia sp. FL1419]|nr:hypothetical protein F5Y11DRAFT_367872 [Daldinia sp. FL1419]
MPTKYIPPLSSLVTKGLQGGLSWETQPRTVYDEEKQLYLREQRYLLHHPHSYHIAKGLFKGLKSSSPMLTSLALSHIYEFATDNVDLCSSFEPMEFFAYAKDSYVWSSRFTDQAFWAFTYKAFHARHIFLNAVLDHGKKEPKESPLARALDEFRVAFSEMYPTDPALVHGKSDKICQVNIDQAADTVSLSSELHAKYFPRHLTHYEEDGDGTDKILRTKEKIKADEDLAAVSHMSTYDGVEMSQILDEELFFYNTECKTKHHNAFKDALDKKGDMGKKAEEVLKGAGSVRKYDSFKDYRETSNGDDVVDLEPTGQSAGVAGGDDGGDSDGDELPNIKKLKITDGDEEEEEGVPDIETLKLDDGDAEEEEKVSSP